MSANNSRKKLATIWLIGSGILFLLILVQTVFGRYGERAAEAWEWLFPHVIPTLSLIIATFVAGARDQDAHKKNIDPFFHKLTASLSGAYLIAVSLTIFLRPFSGWTPLELMRLSNVWLAPFQGLVGSAIGVLFISKGDAKS